MARSNFLPRFSNQSKERSTTVWKFSFPTFSDCLSIPKQFATRIDLYGTRQSRNGPGRSPLAALTCVMHNRMSSTLMRVSTDERRAWGRVLLIIRPDRENSIQIQSILQSLCSNSQEGNPAIVADAPSSVDDLTMERSTLQCLSQTMRATQSRQVKRQRIRPARLC
ncbi:hypothetical protein AC1031_004135 [Aphanomyces cochlioides]|nr:hypothetical protein AC1031_004135 [Aphanomyces cochlioides]